MIEQNLVDQFLKLSVQEFANKTWGSTEQYLEVLEVVKQNNIPVVKRVEKISDNKYAAYFPIKNERFYYTHYFEVLDEEISILGDGVSPACSVALRVHSGNLPLDEILKLTTIVPTKTWQKGDLRGNKKTSEAIYNYTMFRFEPDVNEAGELEMKLLNILSELKPHQDELIKLREANCEVYISAYWESYISNSMLGGFYLNKEIISGLHQLDLEIDFDLNASGTPFN
jgi:hypothetical protein